MGVGEPKRSSIRSYGGANNSFEMISGSTDYTILQVSPSDHEILPEKRKHELSDYDLCAPPVFVTSGLFFPLSPDNNKQKIISDLQTGLAHTLARIPIFTGKLQYDAQTNRLYVLQKKSDTVVLGVRHLDGESPLFPSFAQWEMAGYPDDEIRHHGDQLFPPGCEPSDLPMGIRTDAGCALSAFQVNFIRGGMILVSAFHHCQGDATSTDKFCGTWAHNSKAIAEGSSLLSNFQPSFDRTYFTMPMATASEERVQELTRIVRPFNAVDINPESKLQPVRIDSVTRPESSTESQSAISSRTFHFSQRNCARLKNLAVPSEKGKFVSTYDCIVALLWRAVTRARIPLHPEWDTKTQHTRLSSAVTIRDRFSVTSSDYIGNGVARSLTDSIPIDELLARPIGAAALMSRESILKISASTIPNVLELAKAQEGKKRIALEGSFHLGSDVLASSWTKTNAYNYDFGFGLPIGYRLIPPPLDGMIAIYPPCTRRGDAEGLEVCIILQHACSQRLALDKELLGYSEIRGGGRIQ